MNRQNTIELFVTQKGECFSEVDLNRIKTKLVDMDDDRVQMVTSLEYKKPLTILLVSIFIGSLGIDRFLLGDTMNGAIKLITGGGCGVWWLIDIFLISDKTKQFNYQKFVDIAGE